MKGWEEGGTVDAAREAERQELDRQREEKKQKEIDNFKAFDAMVRKAREEGAAERKKKEELPQEYINIFSGEVIMPKPEVNIFTGEAIVPARESDLVREARQARWAHIEGANDSVPEKTDADMTATERQERECVAEACRTVGDGTYSATDAEAARAAQKHDHAKHNSVEKPTGGGLFNQSFVNSVSLTDENPADSTSKQTESSSPQQKEPVFFNQSAVEVISTIEENPINNSNSKQPEVVSVGVDTFTNMEELD